MQSVITELVAKDVSPVWGGDVYIQSYEATLRVNTEGMTVTIPITLTTEETEVIDALGARIAARIVAEMSDKPEEG